MLCKISVPPPKKRIFSMTPPPLLQKFQLSFIHFFKFIGLTDPPPPPQEIPIPAVEEYGYFLELQIAFHTQVTTVLLIQILKPYIINNEFNVKSACCIHPSVQIFELSSLHLSFAQCSLLQGKHRLFLLAWHQSQSYAGEQFVLVYV